MNVDELEGTELDYAVERVIFQRDKPPEIGGLNVWEKVNDHWEMDVADKLEDGTYARSWTTHRWPLSYHDSDYLALRIVDLLFGIDATEFYLSNQGLGWRVLFVAPDKEMGHAKHPERPIAICRAGIEYVQNNPGLLDIREEEENDAKPSHPN